MVAKTIWMYWQQGWEQAPPLVQRCRRSWQRLNPDFEVRALDHAALLEAVDFPASIDLRRRDLNVQKIAALGRLLLLRKYGGVWSDATVFCTRPLNAWLDEHLDAQFFAFRSPGPDRLMSNWFLAAETSSLILARLGDAFTDYYAQHFFAHQGTPLGARLLEHYRASWSSSIDATLNWHSWYARQVLRVYPYFIFHYTFNKLMLTDPQCAQLWYRGRRYGAEAPHRLQSFAASPHGIADARQEIDRGETPMYKLDWRLDVNRPYWSAVLEHLERTT